MKSGVKHNPVNRSETKREGRRSGSLNLCLISGFGNLDELNSVQKKFLFL